MSAVSVSSAPILIASGASGGHVFPAMTLGRALQEQGHAVQIVLGGEKFSQLVTAANLPLVQLPAAPLNNRGPLVRLLALWRLWQGFGHARRLVQTTRPALVCGTGGYATVALVLAAKLAKVPVAIHEQNVLPGRANRLLAPLADKVLLTFEATRQHLPPRVQDRCVVVGTPLRPEVLAAAAEPPPPGKPGHLHLLVVGGSQGSRILAEVVADAVAHLTAAEQAQLTLTQQVRPEDAARINAIYANVQLAGLTLEPFFADLPARYRAADLLIGRSGTGTLLESAAFGLPAIYVPLELADGHQKYNAAVAEQAGAALVLPQAYFTPANLLVHIRALWQDAAKRAAMGAAARQLADPYATAKATEALLNLAGR